MNFSNINSAIRVAIFLACFLILPSAEGTPDGISLGLGDANDSIAVAKLGVRQHFPWQWFVSKTGQLSGYWELSLGYWRESPDSVFALGFSPVFVYEFTPFSNGHQIYIDGGIGVALLSDTRIGTRDFGSTFQFEDQIGLGFRFGQNRQHDLNIRYLHYSNGGLSVPNDGIDIVLLSYTHWFHHR